jgi:hypothetical protein
LPDTPDNLGYVLDGSVKAIVHNGSNTYLGGDFTAASRPTGGGVVVPSGGTGEPNPASFLHVVGTVEAVAADGVGGWFVGGEFSRVGAVARNGLAHIRADGSVDPLWNPAPSGGSEGYVGALAVSGATVYVAGDFTKIGGQSRTRLAALNLATGAATGWNPSPDRSVQDIVATPTRVYVAGFFSTIGGATRSGLAALDPSTGAAVPSWNPSPDGPMTSLALSGTTLYAGGSFTHVGVTAQKNVAKIDAAAGTLIAGWNPQPDSEVDALAVVGSSVFVGGSFSNISGVARENVAEIDATSAAATAWNPAPDGQLYGIVPASGSVYLTGSFTHIAGVARGGAAQIATGGVATATAWNPQLNGPAGAVARSADGTKLYLGGQISGAGTPLALRGGLAKLAANGALVPTWHPTVDGQVRTLAVNGNTLYLGGVFSTVNGVARHDAAAVDLTTGALTGWNPNPNGEVDAIAATPASIFLGGFFTNAGGIARAQLAAVDPTTGAANSLNPGVTGAVVSLAVYGSTLYVGGSFTALAGQPRINVGAVSTSTGAATAWNPNADSSVFGLAPTATKVFVAGGFSNLGGQPRRGLGAVDTGAGAVTPFHPSFAFSPFGGQAEAVAVSGTTVILGATSLTIPGRGVSGLAAFDGTTGALTSWKPLANNAAFAVAASGSTLPVVYVGGSFTAVGSSITGSYAQFTTPKPPPPPPPKPAALTITGKASRRTVHSRRTFSVTATVKNTGGLSATKVKLCEKAGSGLTVVLKTKGPKRHKKTKPPSRTQCATAATVKPGIKRTLKITFRAPRVRHKSRKVTVTVSAKATGIRTKTKHVHVTVRR